VGVSVTTHYDTLGVPETATTVEIRASYICLARVNHPDFHATDDPQSRELAESRMREINAAWAVLGHEKRRRDYDRQLTRTVRPVVEMKPSKARQGRRMSRRSRRLGVGSILLLVAAVLAMSLGALLGSVAVLAGGTVAAIVGGAASLTRTSP
jgi:hypothetical protein